jgi:hypothetical protein
MLDDEDLAAEIARLHPADLEMLDEFFNGDVGALLRTHAILDEAARRHAENMADFDEDAAGEDDERDVVVPLFPDDEEES